MSCAELDELSGAIALGAALPDELAGARAHLATCRRGHPEMRDFLLVAALLPETLEPVAPEAALRTRVLTAARFARGPEPTALRVDAPAAPLPAAPRRTTPGLAWLAAALLVVSIGFGAWALRVSGDLERQREQIALQQQALAGLAAGGEFVPFHGEPEAGATYGGIVRPPSGQPVLVLANMHQPDGGVYQLWMVHNGQRADMGTFLPAADGRYAVVLPDLSAAEALEITSEPQHVPQPTAPPIMTAFLSEGAS